MLHAARVVAGWGRPVARLGAAHVGARMCAPLCYTRMLWTLGAVRAPSAPGGHAAAAADAPPAPAVVLRPYQAECVETCLAALCRGVSRIGVSSPTGSGKTTMFTELLHRMPSPPGCSGQVLILVNAVALAEQAAATVRRILPHLSLELEQGTKHKASGVADVTVATVQSICRPNRLEKYDPARFKCVIVDEAHHSTSASYRSVLAHFNNGVRVGDAEADTPHAVPIIGFSATFSRHDGMALGTVYEEIVYHKDFLAMMDEKWCVVPLTQAVSAAVYGRARRIRPVQRLAHGLGLQRCVARQGDQRAVNQRADCALVAAACVRRTAVDAGVCSEH